jgi:acetyl esterase/lipase
MFNRRLLLGLGLAAALPKAAAAQSNAQASGQEGLPQSGGAVGLRPPLPKQDIWPGDAPGGEKVAVEQRVVLRKPGGDPNDTAFYNIRKPWLSHRAPARPNGGAVLIAPGGGYVRIAASLAGGDLDQWLADEGYHVFTLFYRLPADGWAAGPDVALQDVQRAIRVIRSRAGELKLDPERLAVMGFSAGGHVAGLAATRFAEPSYAPVDAADALSAKPAVVALCYPVITMMEPYPHKGSVKEMLGANPTEAARLHASIEKHVPADAAPAYVCGTTDDPAVPMQNAILAYEAFKAQKVASELHLYEGATHGFPLRDKAGKLQPWAAGALAFMERHGLKKV